MIYDGMQLGGKTMQYFEYCIIILDAEMFNKAWKIWKNK